MNATLPLLLLSQIYLIVITSNTSSQHSLSGIDKAIAYPCFWCILFQREFDAIDIVVPLGLHDAILHLHLLNAC